MECIGEIKLYSCPVDHGNEPRYQREQKAVEALVHEAFGSKAIKLNHPSGAPYIKINGTIIDNISISHSRHYATLAVAPDCQRIGIDIEDYRPQLNRVAKKFLSDEELKLFTTDEALLQAWTLKEAAYKALQIPGLALTDIKIKPGSSRITASGHIINIKYSDYYLQAHFMSIVTLEPLNL